VEHSHSGFNAFRHHLLGHVTRERLHLYREMVGHLVTARAILDAVVEGRIDVGPLDAYWHALIARHRPELTTQVRVVGSTDLAPIPAFVAAPRLPADDVARLRSAFCAAAGRPWFAQLRDMLLLDGFAPVTRDAFATTLAWDREAKAAGYPLPR
jgi:ABC-type phosphate/phosphonate transport system substrate-binding protein